MGAKLLSGPHCFERGGAVPPLPPVTAPQQLTVLESHDIKTQATTAMQVNNNDNNIIIIHINDQIDEGYHSLR
jgi:hypothetical protein